MMPRSCCASSWGSLDKSTQDFLIAAVDAAAALAGRRPGHLGNSRPGATILAQRVDELGGAGSRNRLADLICADTQVECWTCVRDDIRTAILTQGWNADIGAFTQVFGGSDLDASTLLIALVGILPADDIRLHSTITAIIAGCPITAACSTATAATTDWVVKREHSYSAHFGWPKRWPSPAVLGRPSASCGWRPVARPIWACWPNR